MPARDRALSGVSKLHEAVKRGDLESIRSLLRDDRRLANSVAFFGRPEVVAVLLQAGSAPSQRNKHGLTPLGCAVGGTQGRWTPFSNATTGDWQRAAEIIRAYGGEE